MDLYEDLTKLWIDCVSIFLMLSFLVFIGCLIWQHLKNKKEQAKILAQYQRNFKILEELKNRY